MNRDLVAMESTKNASDDEAKQQAAPPNVPSAGDDLISDLPDHVLLRILGMVAAARDVVRTGALSRRWRGLWTRAPALAFSPWPELGSAGDAERYAAFADGVLAQRARSGDSSNLLTISLDMATDCLRGEAQLVAPSVGAAEGWIRWAAQHAVSSFLFRFRLPRKAKPQNYSDSRHDDDDPNADDHDHDHDGEDEEVNVVQEQEEEEDVEQVEEEEQEEQEVEDVEQVDDDDDDDKEDEEKPLMSLDDLPSSATLERMYLDLDSARVRLPSNVVFQSLASLTLKFIDLAPGSGQLLARLLSSACCPSLQRLHMQFVNFKLAETKELVLDAGALLELSLKNIHHMKSLELRTPNLEELEIEGCEKLTEVKVSAPMLEKLAFLRNAWRTGIQGDLQSVWGLQVNLTSHMFSDSDINDSGICVLKRCSSAEAIRVDLDIPMEIDRRVDMIKDKIPQLPHVTTLAVHIHLS
ncbi:hypothetical protein ACP4OV_007911 [Aristida adscensionis]